MPLTRGQRGAIKRAITRFAEATDNYAFRGTIPAGGDDEAADAAYEEVEREYVRSRECLEALIERYVA